jgi:hypothetical protein
MAAKWKLDIYTSAEARQYLIVNSLSVALVRQEQTSSSTAVLCQVLDPETLFSPYSLSWFQLGMFVQPGVVQTFNSLAETPLLSQPATYETVESGGISYVFNGVSIAPGANANPGRLALRYQPVSPSAGPITSGIAEWIGAGGGPGEPAAISAFTTQPASTNSIPMQEPAVHLDDKSGAFQLGPPGTASV